MRYLTKMKNKKLTVTGIILFLAVVIWATMLFGCATNKPEFKPLPPEKLQDLLHTADTYAYKSITIKDLTIEEFCG